MKTRTLALVGDYSESVVAHQAIPRALELARERIGVEVAWNWVPTPTIGTAGEELSGYSGVWLVPASPYQSTEGALAAVRWAREGRRPFLGTCGGFQHALLEFARNVAGLPNADHEETNPVAKTMLLTALSCSLVGQSGLVHLAARSRLHEAYGRNSVLEGYHCNYGFNPAYRRQLECAGLQFTAWDDAGAIRGAELPSHPFFVGTLFQPERAALKGELSLPVVAFLTAVAGVTQE
jgi:CTP synthase